MITFLAVGLILLVPPTVICTPVVLWHGMGDSCCNPLSMGSVKKMLEKELETYVLSLMVGNSVASDTTNGFFMDTNEQIDFVCNTIKKDPNLQDGYNAMGFSQGGQFLRGLAQRCPQPPMKQLISIGGQHQGVYGFPHCPGSWFVCKEVDRLLNLGAYTDYVQSHLVQAQYWHDPLDEDEYKKKSKFIAEINQEGTVKLEYKQNLMRVSNITFVMFNKDTMVVPKESEWFGFYKPGQDKELMTLQEGDLWKEDKLGLKEMDSQGRLSFLKIEADHLRVPEAFWSDEIIPRLKV
ncbi:palmitoyl-protein thioesterase 1-like [Bolinopsis microptera]|uniref:palmitoyl-protein thioesterase 1-like n=1 Tax=Bolinopsis microptera TaxID=2820187 RepID=UPI00307B0E2E